jgi:hypothetical protein
MSYGETIHCPICGVTHGFGVPCPPRRPETDEIARLQAEVTALREVLRWEVLPVLRGVRSDPQRALVAVERALGLSR